MSISLPDCTCVASAPPPHCWKMFGGSEDWSATGILVFNDSFCTGVILKVTFGWGWWYASATDCQTLLPGSWAALCHQVSVTFAVADVGAFDEPLQADAVSVIA